MITIRISDGIIHLSESKAVCFECNEQIPFDAIDKKWQKSKKYTIKVKCKCGAKVDIAQSIDGDFISFKNETK